jgi:predicted dehydrogenase
MRFLNRRDFLFDSALAAALAGTGLTGNSLQAADQKKGKKISPNDVFHVAVVGVNGRGMSHVGGFAKNNGCVVTHLCDADSAVIGQAMKTVETKQGQPPRFVQDFRKLLDDKSIDIISIATPNHWHSLMAIWAMQAGKDVYVEKPVSHNVSEGRRAVEAARRFNRICQAGTQNRSATGLRTAMEFLHSGGLGKIRLARALCYKRRRSIGKVKGPQPIPPTCDYDLWCGPAPKKPLMRKNLHYDWHWVWDTGNGDLGNQGIHQMDIARWGLGQNELARSVISVGGRFGYLDDGETPNTQICVFDYGNCELIFEVRGLETEKLLGTNIGNIFYGSKGYLVCSSSGTAVAFSPEGEQLRQFKGGENHFGNFIKAVRQRDASILKSDILEGHLSSALCHLGNISYFLGTEQPFSKKTRAFGNDKEAYETLARMEQHLQDNQVPLDKTRYRVGRRLTVDPRTETFVNDSEANNLLTRTPRPPFVVPEKV